MLDRFKEEKRPQMKDNGWCLDKLRIPFITWLTAVQKEKEKKDLKSSNKKETYKNYPETHYES